MTTERKIEIATLILSKNSDEFLCCILIDLVNDIEITEPESDQIKGCMFEFIKQNPELNNNYRNQDIMANGAWFDKSRDESNNYSSFRLNKQRINFLEKYIEHLKQQSNESIN